jgi:tRNA-splicing ligase RtcB
MASATYVVRGKGSVMSRTQAKKTFAWAEVNKILVARGVVLLSAGLDEVPMVYKDIDAVMAAQGDLVEKVASFRPRIVKMAPGNEPAED